jgi:hypothetical protein
MLLEREIAARMLLAGVMLGGLRDRGVWTDAQWVRRSFFERGLS